MLSFCKPRLAMLSATPWTRWSRASLLRQLGCRPSWPITRGLRAALIDSRRAYGCFPTLRGQALVLFAHFLEPFFLHVLIPQECAGGGFHTAGHAVSHALEVAHDFARGFGVGVRAWVGGLEISGVVCRIGRVGVRWMVGQVLVTGGRRVDGFGVCCWVAGSVAVSVGAGGHVVDCGSDGLTEAC